jgi:hypothetical protein
MDDCPDPSDRMADCRAKMLLPFDPLFPYDAPPRKLCRSCLGSSLLGLTPILLGSFESLHNFAKNRQKKCGM